MAYGSATVRTKTTTKTSTTTSSTAQSSAGPVASTSRLPANGGRRPSAGSLPDPPTSDSEDSDFGSKARKKVQKEARKEAKRLAEELASKGAKGKRKRKSVKAEPDVSSADEKPTKASRKRSIKADPEPVRRDGTSSDDSSTVDATRAPVMVKTVKKERRGDYKRIRRHGPDGNDLTHDQVVRRHLQGKWRSAWQRAHPEFMSEGRAQLETVYNPLPRLLGIELQLIDSEEERGTLHRATKTGDNLDQDELSHSDDDEASSTAERDREAKIASTTFNWKKQMDTDEDSDEDANPKSLSAAAPLSTLPDIKPVAEPESDPEPDTEDDDGDIVIKSEDSKADRDEDDEEDDFARRIRLANEVKARKAAAAVAAEAAQTKKDEIDRRISALRAEQAAKRATQDDLMDVDEEEPVLTISQERARDHQQKLIDAARYPMLAKGRPKFQITSRQQEDTGPLVLAPGVEVPATINRFLRDYQRDGVKFMYRQFAAGMGGVLGDDMGLGKTIQVIAFLAAIMKKTGKKQDDERRKSAINDHSDGFLPPEAHGFTCLISCPAVVVHNWAREFKTWGYFKVAVYDGTDRKDVLSHFQKVDVVIAGIEATRSNIGELAGAGFSIVIVDEAHRIKNPNSITTKALHLFPTKLRFGLTGTAIQNKLEELWCVLDWANPGQVGVKNNWNLYVSRPLKYSQKIDVDQDVLATGRQRAEALVFKLLPHFWLRRTKDMVQIQLPKKTDCIVLCPLTATQKRVYKKILASEDIKRILTNEDPCDCGQVDNQGFPYQKRKCCDPFWYTLILKYITLFQKISNHLALIYPDKEEKNTNPDKYNQDFEWARAAFPDDFSKRTRGGLSSLDPSLCGKWPILEQLLARWYEQGDKVLIFSLSLKILDLIKDLMAQTQYRFVTLDGSVAGGDQRMKLVDTFNTDPDCFCFLISTRAGGVGLNLTAANRVVIFDPNWNPSHDLQAMDRAYRFGQTRDVDVYRLIGSGTLEELIYNRQQYKRAQMSMGYDATAERRQFTGVEGDKEDRGELFGCKNIFRFHEHSSLTEMTIQACNVAELEFALKNTVISDTDAENDSGDIGIDDDDINKIAGVGVVPGAPMSKEQLARAEKTKAERDAINNILAQNSVTYSTESDATLGGSRAEQDRSRRAIAETKTQKRRDSSSRPTKAKAAPRAAAAAATASTWDPSARRVGKSKLNAPPAPIKATSPRLETKSETHGSIAASLGIDPDVDFGELVAPAGYAGSKGQKRLVVELAKLDRKQYEKRIREILQTYVAKSRT